MQLHLDSSDARVRRLGMFVGEVLTSSLPAMSASASKLEFEVSKPDLELFHQYRTL